MSTILWVVGEPGAGKTTLVRRFFGSETITVTKPKWTLTAGQYGLTALAGHYKGDTFDGADTVPYNGVAEALEYWNSEHRLFVQLVIFDGDRFSNGKVVEYFEERRDLTPMRLCCILLSGGPEIAARRRARSEQNETWVKGRITKARNFFESFADRVEIQGSEEEMFRRATAFLEGPALKLPVGQKAADRQANFFQ